MRKKDTEKGFIPLEIARPKGPLGAQARARFLMGFTLLEMLIVFALISILTAFVAFPLLGYKNAEEFNTQEKLMVAMMRDAQQRSVNREEGTRWGVRFTNTAGQDTFQLFNGPNATGQVNDPSGLSNPPCPAAQQTVTPVETKYLKSSSDFTDPGLGCSKDIVFNPGSGTPNPPSGASGVGFQNKVIIIPKGFASPDKIITVQDNGTISF